VNHCSPKFPTFYVGTGPDPRILHIFFLALPNLAAKVFELLFVIFAELNSHATDRHITLGPRQEDRLSHLF
jgi:hypothetical protein